MTIRDPEGKVLGHKDLGSIAYEYDQFAGTQILVYFDDILIDEVVNIRFDVQQTKTPVWGYASQYYSFIADGHVIVTGNLTINFKESGYLLYPIMGNFNQKMNGEVNSTYETNRAMKANVEQAFEQSAHKEYRKNLNTFYRDLQSMPDNVFEKYAEEFEDKLWFSSDPGNAGSRDQLFSKNIRTRKNGYKTDITKEDVWNHRRADQYPNIDIMITYGDFSRNSHNHTVKKILDVSFIGQSQIIESSGQPVLEEYTFIARNLV